MAIEFSKNPGRCERHLQRKHGNPLFPGVSITGKTIAEARARDDRELHIFVDSYKEILNTIAGLSGNVDSQIILDIKEKIDRLYEQACGLGGDREQEKEGLTRLYQAISSAIRDGAANDPVAMEKLDDEARAHDIHWQLLQQLLVADLLYPGSPITPEELVPTLLSENTSDFSAAMEIFRDEHRVLILQQARKLLAEYGNDMRLNDARNRLKVLEKLVGSSGNAQ